MSFKIGDRVRAEGKLHVGKGIIVEIEDFFGTLFYKVLFTDGLRLIYFEDNGENSCKLEDLKLDI